jgi:ribosome-associated toxin RatA of RatAB toxin-antitoxin module
MIRFFDTHDGRRRGAVRFLVAAAVVACAALPGARDAAAADPAPSPEVTVRENRGTYSVTARFVVPESADVVLAVLADYERIPRFMPDVRSSVVLERAPGRTVVEQEAVAKFMMFSKQLHLVLEVSDRGRTLSFADRCGKSFKSYAGAWRTEPLDGGTLVTYELTAQPGFEVPEFILKRLLKRDSGVMIHRLRSEFAARARETRRDPRP